MGKRKHSRDDISSVRKKIKKLERKLRKYRSESTDSSSSDCVQEYREDAQNHACSANEYEELSGEYYPHEEMNHIEASTATTSSMDPIPTPSEKDENLDPEILSILGEDPTIVKDFGDDLHKDIAARWSHILCNGLTKEGKSEILKEYLPAKNCPNMKGPQLNLEIKAALSSINVKKDMHSQFKQNQISACLSAVGKALNLVLLSKESQVQSLIKPLSDAGRLLCECHYRESQSRRYAIMNVLNKPTRDIVVNTKFDDTLFGSNLADHLKTSKAISKSASEMKSQRTPLRPTFSSRGGTLNARGIPRVVAGATRLNPMPKRPAPPPAARDRRRDPGSRRNYYPAQANSRTRRN